MKGRFKRHPVHIVRLKSFIRKNGKVKTALALGLKETNAISNWLARNEVPESYKESTLSLNKTPAMLINFN